MSYKALIYVAELIMTAHAAHTLLGAACICTRLLKDEWFCFLQVKEWLLQWLSHRINMVST
jgi:hypothetical protein